ncbi:hypothetical protein [Bacillus sp. Marseille-P3800]|uniref:hypothetical protein n=1 Tax=Bacillus sp. Marseille-P3800 TaxID=2014782 RepID=UPI000C08B4B7|nr:hypothetical protein [Bacillus sp. Marseille-P3800]
MEIIIKLTKFIGSDAIKESVAGEELVPLPPHGYNPYSLKEFTLQVESDCTVSINDSSPIYVRAGSLNISKHQADIDSFKIMEDGISYNWMAAL